MVDVDGVISLFGFDPDARPPGTFMRVDGIPHWVSASAGDHLRALRERFELVWCTGWEEKANEYLLGHLGLPEPLPYLTFEWALSEAGRHWKLAAIERFASRRPLAWIDDHHDGCHDWALEREAPTLLVSTDPTEGITASHVELLLDWAGTLAR